jgi:hypothetical protein
VWRLRDIHRHTLVAVKRTFIIHPTRLRKGANRLDLCRVDAVDDSSVFDCEQGILHTMPRQLNLLRQVLPIAQSVTQDGVTVTLFSLELYAEGMQLRCRLQVDDQRLLAWTRSGSVTSPIVIRLSFHLTDDRNGDYWLTFGGGNGSPVNLDYRAIGWKPLATAVRTVQVELTEIRWHDLSGADSAQPIHMLKPGWTWHLSVPMKRR